MRAKDFCNCQHAGDLAERMGWAVAHLQDGEVAGAIETLESAMREHDHAQAAYVAMMGDGDRRTTPGDVP